MAVERNEAVSRRFYDEVWNRGDFAVIDQLADPSLVAHDAALPEDVRGPDGLKGLIGSYRRAFPDVEMVVADMISDGDKVTVRWSASGTHLGELMGLAPTGRRSRVTGISIERYRDGRLVEAWVNWDTLGMLQQIGAAPAPGSTAERVGRAVQRVTAPIQRRRRGSQPV